VWVFEAMTSCSYKRRGKEEALESLLLGRRQGRWEKEQGERKAQKV
jgi:hypothetical protein